MCPVREFGCLLWQWQSVDSEECDNTIQTHTTHDSTSRSGIHPMTGLLKQRTTSERGHYQANVLEDNISTQPELQCPKCASTELTVTLVFSGVATCRFGADHSTEVLAAGDMDSEISRLSRCSCRRCRWEGLARDAMSAVSRSAAPSVALSETELRQLMQSLHSAELSSRMREQLSLLVDELIDLRRQRKQAQ